VLPSGDRIHLLTGEIVPTIVSHPQVVETGSEVPTMIGLVADDFTGAADSAGVFTQHGWTVRLLVDGVDADGIDTETDAPAEPNTVLAIATGSRSLSQADAADVTARAVRRLAAAGVQRLFVKVDSTMRGPVPAQVSGAMDAWGATHPTPRAIVSPAFPAQGRTASAASSSSMAPRSTRPHPGVTRSHPSRRVVSPTSCRDSPDSRRRAPSHRFPPARTPTPRRTAISMR